MLQNEERLRRLVYEIQQKRGIDSSIVVKIDEYLVSIEKKIQMAHFVYELMGKFEFPKLHECDKIGKKESNKQIIELDGVSFHFSNGGDHDILISFYFDGLLSNLVAAINIFCSLLNVFFQFSKEAKYAPNIWNIINTLKTRFPNHELTKLFLREYSRDPRTWMFTLRELRNNLHHESVYIGEFEVIDPSSREVSFFIYERYFNSSVLKVEREIRYFSNNVLERTEQLLSEMYGILIREVELSQEIPFASTSSLQENE